MKFKSQISFSKTVFIFAVILALAVTQQNLQPPPSAQYTNIGVTTDDPVTISNQQASNIRTISVKNFLKPKVKDQCIWMKCGKGFQCLRGKCVPITCKKDNDCQNNLICEAGSCVTDQCIWMKCGKGLQCIRGKCVPITCTKDDDCMKGKICKSGKCIEGLNICTDQSYRTVYCPEGGISFQSCPLPSFAPPGPPPSYCGVTASGQRINFLFPQCSVCVNKDIVYYFDKPCYDAPFICEKQEQCQGYYCSGKCSQDSDCPFDWQICNQGKCWDSCIVMKCANGPCKFGQCSYRVNPPSCSYPQGPMYGGSCPDEQLTCFGFTCVNLCDRKRCAPNQKCFRGQCLPE